MCIEGPYTHTRKHHDICTDMVYFNLKAVTCWKQLGLVTSNVIGLYIYIYFERCNLIKINSGFVVTCMYKLYKLVLL